MSARATPPGEGHNIDRDLIQLVSGEYMEMPGLQLTIAQACRLWNIDLDTSLAVLNRLVADEFLRLSGRHYVRTGVARRVA